MFNLASLYLGLSPKALTESGDEPVFHKFSLDMNSRDFPSLQPAKLA